MKQLSPLKPFTRLATVSLVSLLLMSCENKIPEFFEDLGEDDDPLVCDEDVTTVDFKQIAYWKESDNETLESIDFSMLTHIIYDNIGVSSDGELILPSDIDDFEDMLELAENAGVFTMVSIGNSSDSAFNAIAASDTALNNFVDNIEDLIDDYDLDGIDINWQFPTTDDEGDLLEDLVKEVQESLSDDGKLLSLVVASGEFESTDDGITQDALDYPDFINVMALGSDDDDDDLHSSLADAQQAIAYWTARCVVQNEMVLAIPLYSEGDEELDFAEIVEDDEGNGDDKYACVDESEGRNYNGIPTVTAKTAYAELNAGGVILTSLEQDYFENDDYSILATVDGQVLGSPNTACD